MVIIGFSEKIPDPSNAKEYQNSYLKRKNTNTIRQTKKISQVCSGKNYNSSLYSETKKYKFFEQKNVKLRKRAHALKSYASSCHVEILYSFYRELKDT